MVLENNYKFEKFDSEILREYDIRGIFNKTLNTNTAYTLGRIFGEIVNKKSQYKKSQYKKVIISKSHNVKKNKM